MFCASTVVVTHTSCTNLAQWIFMYFVSVHPLYGTPVEGSAMLVWISTTHNAIDILMLWLVTVSFIYYTMIVMNVNNSSLQTLLQAATHLCVLWCYGPVISLVSFNIVRRKRAPNHPRSSNQKHEEFRERHVSKPSWLLPLEIVMGTIVAAFFVVAAIMTICKYQAKATVIMPWKKTLSGQERKQSLIADIGILKDVPLISRADLEAACEDFSNIIGSSPDSMVYKGTTSNGTEIAVTSMRISTEDWTTHSEHYFQQKRGCLEMHLRSLHPIPKTFSWNAILGNCILSPLIPCSLDAISPWIDTVGHSTLVADLAKLNHKNIVKLLGYCAESEPFTRMLVFEYASNGTLYEHLHYGEEGQLGWTTRMKIIVGVAYGLQYMHHELVYPVAILDLDSNAVYLTEDFSPKLADFEIWKAIFAKNERRSGFKGSATVGRDSVESSDRDPSDIESNIFSFGVLLLEIITGRFPYSKDQGSLLEWAQEYLELPEVISYLVDPSLRYFRYSDLQTVCEVVRLCIQSDYSKRPSMKQITSMLEAGIDTSFEAAGLKESPLMWAELTLLS
eukprot:Gb_01740 [translate_table: standard]